MNQSHSPSQSKYTHLAIGVLATLLLANQLHAQCPPVPAPTTHPNGVIEGPVSCLGDQSVNSTVAIDDLGRFIVAFERPFGVVPNVWAQRFNPDGTPNGATSALSDTTVNTDVHHLPTVAMSSNGRVRVGWLGSRNNPVGGQEPDSVVLSDFDFLAFPPVPVRPPAAGIGQASPSVGISDSAGVAAQTFAQIQVTPPMAGLFYQAGPGAIMQFRGCDPLSTQFGNICFTSEGAFTPTAWQPVVAQRSDGVVAISWAEAEDPDFRFSPFNIKLRLVDSAGASIGGVGTLGEVLVNDPAIEPPGSIQQSPGLAFDDAGNIVCIWTGPALSGCPGGRHVFARRFQWSGDPAAAPVAVIPFGMCQQQRETAQAEACGSQVRQCS